MRENWRTNTCPYNPSHLGSLEPVYWLRSRVHSRVLPCHKSKSYQSCSLFVRWNDLIYYINSNNNNNKAETIVIKVDKWLSIWFIYYRNGRMRLVRGSNLTEVAVRVDTWSVVSVCVGLVLLNVTRGFECDSWMLNGSSPRSTAHLAQGMSQRLLTVGMCRPPLMFGISRGCSSRKMLKEARWGRDGMRQEIKRQVAAGDR